MENSWSFGGAWQATAFLGATAVIGVAQTSHAGAAMIYPDAAVHPPADYHDPLGMLGLGAVGVSFAAYMAWRKRSASE
jgi:hypothetical protein